jgi:DNA polymerase-1
MVAAYVLNPSRNSYGLKELSFEMLGEAMTTIDQLIGKGAKQRSMLSVPVSDVAPYACADADMTLRLAQYFKPELEKQKLMSLFMDMEMPLVEILAGMEINGIRVDEKRLNELGTELQGRMKSLEAEIHALAGEAFNVNSPKQLASILFEKLKLPAGRKTKTGFSTDEDVLSKLAEQHALPSKLLEFRELQKLQSTYVEGLREAIDPVSQRVHTHFNQTVAATGRLSSTNPNLQNIPIRTETGRKIRQVFVADPGCVLLSADYSQIDLRMLAHISGDPVLSEAFRKGEDVHTTTAVEIFGVKPDQVTQDLRRIAKSINFGIVYGISAFGLSQQLNIAMDEAKRHIERYFERYAGVRAWMDKCLAEAKEAGSVRTLLGRIRYVPEIQSKNPNIRGFGERIALNTPIQGTSADVIKLAMVHLFRAKESLQAKMLLQVHDELVFEVAEKDVVATARGIKPYMENAVKLSIPVLVDFKMGSSWAQMKPLSL